ncbi:MAG TPA: hypothetical protein VLB44_26780 [Kofleriaceae bacterium]|nr:hypothetical protein [Kofleriaceae bacterium]
MSISDTQFRGAVIAGAIALVGVIGGLRFCGSVSIPDKPQVVAPSGTSTELLAKGAATSNVYLELLAKDAANAGVPAPSLEQMAKKLPYSADEQRHVLEVGQAPTQMAGLAIRAQHQGDLLVLEIKNTTKATLAYRVVTQVIPASQCQLARPLPIDAITIASDTTTTRTECKWREDMVVAVTQVETMEVSPLSAYLLGQVPPATLGIDPLVARGHRAPKDRCATQNSRNVQSEMEKGAIGWRDLVDFYARHRCSTYQFPSTYRALTSDGSRPIPAVSGSN